MASKPILFSTPMVQAILDDRKTQTRRVIKDKDIINRFDIDVDGKPIAYIDQETGDSYPPTAIAKYQVGDILWVRETWSKDENGEYVYRTNYGTTEDDSFPPSMFKWKPSIHMPREAARIFLRVTNVRVERLQEITPKDAWEEGCRIGNFFPWEKHIPELQQQCRDILFKSLWDGLNAKRGYGWDTNPWVWVIEFERVSEDGSSKDE
jgi:hypothetical protein